MVEIHTHLSLPLCCSHAISESCSCGMYKRAVVLRLRAWPSCTCPQLGTCAHFDRMTLRSCHRCPAAAVATAPGWPDARAHVARACSTADVHLGFGSKVWLRLGLLVTFASRYACCRASEIEFAFAALCAQVSDNDEVAQVAHNAWLSMIPHGLPPHC